MKRIKYVFAIICVVCAGASCSQEKPENIEGTEKKVTGKDVLDQTKETLETTKNFLAQKKSEYQAQLETKLQEADGMIQELQQKADEAKVEVKAKYTETIELLKTKQQEAKEKMMELKSATAESWKDMQSGMDAALDDLINAFSEAKSRFQESETESTEGVEN